MIDRTARTQLGELIRHWGSGRLTNDQYDKIGNAITKHTKDDAVFHIWMPLAYQNEYKTYRFVGKYRLSKKERRFFARCILFLQNDAEYDDPLPPPGCAVGLLSLLTFGLWKDNNYQVQRQYEENIWPFATAEDLDAAQQHPKLLCGNRC